MVSREAVLFLEGPLSEVSLYCPFLSGREGAWFMCWWDSLKMSLVMTNYSDTGQFLGVM